MQSENRVSPRRAVLWSGKLKFGDYTFDCQIWNISLGGARIRVGLPLLEGSKVLLSVDRYGSITGEVAWQADGNLGLRFDDDPKLIRDIFGDSVVKLGLEGDDTAATG